MQFIESTLKLNTKIGTTVVKMAPKYKMLYGDDMAKTGLQALRLLETGNGIFVSKDTLPELFAERLKMFETAKGYLYNIPTTLRIWMNIRIDTEKPSSETREKWLWQVEDMTQMCYECVQLVSGVIKADKARYKEYRKNKGISGQNDQI